MNTKNASLEKISGQSTTTDLQSVPRPWLETAKLLAIWMLALLLFILMYSRMLFIILMSEYDFFSYDIFEVGGFGMMVFYATTELMIILSGLMLFGFFIPLAARMKTGRTPWSDLRPILVLNIFCWLALATVIFDRGWKTEQHFFPLVLSALAALYISAALHAPRRLKIRSAIGLIGIMVLLQPYIQNLWSIYLLKDCAPMA
ncbi:hypothetical protein FHY29_004166 [Xanthomonas arboricola]